MRINCGSVFRPADQRHLIGGGELRTVEAADGAGSEHDNLHGPEFITPRGKREAVLVRHDSRKGRSISRSPEVLDLRERFARFLGPTHLPKDVREQEILPRLIGLPRHGTALSLAGLFEFVLANAQQAIRFSACGIVHIERCWRVERLLRPASRSPVSRKRPPSVIDAPACHQCSRTKSSTTGKRSRPGLPFRGAICASKLISSQFPG